MDPAKLAENMGIEEERYRELLALFVETCMFDLDGLQSAMVSENLDQASSTLHSLKGAAGCLGLEAIHGIALKIEIDIEDGHMDAISDRVYALREKVEVIQASL